MEKMEEKRHLLLFLSIFLMILSVNFFCISQKKGLFCDEQENVYHVNAISSQFNNKFIPKNIYTGEQLKKLYLWNDSSIKDVFRDLKYLYLENLDRPHTNLYYSFFRVWFSGVDFNDLDYYIFKGCMLNIVFFCFAFFFMYKLLALIFDNDKLSVGLGLLVAFLNTGTLTNLIFIREYYLQMTMFIVLSYFVVKNITDYEKEKSKLTIKNMCLQAFITSLTLLSGYYSIFFVLFLYLWMFYKSLKNRDFSFVKYLIKAVFLSLIFTLIIYPLYFTGFFSHRGIGEISTKMTVKWHVLDYLHYLYINIYTHFTNYVLYIPVILLCIIMLFLPNKKNEKGKNIKNTQNSNLLILFFVSFVFCVVIIFLQRCLYTYYRYIAATYPLLTIIIPYLCNKKTFKPICSTLFIIIYLYAAFVSPANSSETKGKFYYAIKDYTYTEDRDIVEKMQALNLPIFIYENNSPWRKYKILAYLKDQNVFYAGDLNLIPQSEKFIMLVCDDKKDSIKPVPKILKNKKPNIIFSETNVVGYILTKD